MARGDNENEGFVLPELIFRCTACGVVVDRCTLCGTGFLKHHVIRCRREEAHDHEDCAIARGRRASTTAPRMSTPIPNRDLDLEREKRRSGVRNKRGERGEREGGG